MDKRGERKKAAKALLKQVLENIETKEQKKRYHGAVGDDSAGAQSANKSTSCCSRSSPRPMATPR